MNRNHIIVRSFRVASGRLKGLPTKFWAILATLFGIADFLTWSFLAQTPQTDRWKITVGIVIFSLLITFIALVRQPTPDEKAFHARELAKSARKFYDDLMYTDALPLYQASVDLDPDEILTVAMLGRTLLKLGKFDESIPYLSRSIEEATAPAYRRTYRINRAIANIMLGDFGSSMSDLDENISELPDSKVAFLYRAVVWLCMNRPENALENLNKIISIYPSFIRGRALKVVAFSMIGDRLNAQNELRRIENLLPESADQFYCYAIALVHLDKIEEAVAALKVALEMDTKFIPRYKSDPLLERIRNRPDLLALLEPDSQ